MTSDFEKDMATFDAVWNEDKNAAAIITIAGLVRRLMNAIEAEDDGEVFVMLDVLSAAAEKALQMNERYGSDAVREMVRATREGTLRQGTEGDSADGTQDSSEGSVASTR